MVALLGGGRWMYSDDGRERRRARRGAHLLERDLLRRHPAVALQFARERDPRHRQHGGAGDRDRASAQRCSIPLSPCLIFGWGPFPRWASRAARSRCSLYYALGQRRVRAIPVVGPQRRAAFAARPRACAGRSSATSCASARSRRSSRVADQPHDRDRDRSRRAVRRRPRSRVTASARGSNTCSSRSRSASARRSSRSSAPTSARASIERALRAAWIGAAIAAGLTEAIGLCAAAFPHAWLTLFDTDPAMLEAGSQYLRTVGPFYGLFGLGMALYFASQGAGGSSGRCSRTSRASRSPPAADGSRSRRRDAHARVPRAERGARGVRS